MVRLKQQPICILVNSDEVNPFLHSQH
jgi:hypothetical protein